MVFSILCVCCVYVFISFFFFKQKTAYELRISDLSSDVCSSDLTRTVMVAAPQLALEAAAKVARAAGVTPVILGDAIEGEAREVATVMAGIASQVRRHAPPAGVPCVLLAGERRSVVGGTRGAVGVDLGGGSINKKKSKINTS